MARAGLAGSEAMCPKEWAQLAYLMVERVHLKPPLQLKLKHLCAEVM